MHSREFSQHCLQLVWLSFQLGTLKEKINAKVSTRIMQSCRQNTVKCEFICSSYFIGIASLWEFIAWLFNWTYLSQNSYKYFNLSVEILLQTDSTRTGINLSWFWCSVTLTQNSSSRSKSVSPRHEAVHSSIEFHLLSLTQLTWIISTTGFLSMTGANPWAAFPTTSAHVCQEATSPTSSKTCYKKVISCGWAGGQVMKVRLCRAWMF